RRPLSRVARRPPTDAGRSTLSLVPSARVGTPRTARLLASLLLVALLVSAGGVRAEPGPPPDRPWPLSPAAVALAQKRAVERLAALRLPVFCGAGRVPDVALTFDDGPSPYTLPLLRLLRRASASAT